MGMDVYGKKPTSDAGEYFRNNCWFWRPLWAYCESVAPEICSKVESPGTNDGDGLGAKDSKALAAILELELKSGRTKAYEMGYKLSMDSIPDETCIFCFGTGKRTDMTVRLGCNACEGKGHVRPVETTYPFETDNVRNFVKFLKDCGGFEIC